MIHKQIIPMQQTETKVKKILTKEEAEKLKAIKEKQIKNAKQVLK